jgi:hypothetical protein
VLPVGCAIAALVGVTEVDCWLGGTADLPLSAGRGLALAYFYNFVLPFAESLRQSKSALFFKFAHLRVERSRGVFEKARPHLGWQAAQMHVLVPRGFGTVHGASTVDVKDLLAMTVGDGAILAVEPENKTPVASRRPLFAHLYSESTQHPAVLFDIPTIICTLVEMARNVQAGSAHAPSEAFVANALVSFAAELARLCCEHAGTAGMVAVVSVPELTAPVDLTRVLEKLGSQLQMERTVPAIGPSSG